MNPEMVNTDTMKYSFFLIQCNPRGVHTQENIQALRQLYFAHKKVLFPFHGRQHRSPRSVHKQANILKH